jgi:hypothetical protein
MRYPLPYGFARSSQLLIEDDGQEPALAWSAARLVGHLRSAAQARGAALAVADSGALAHRISAAYAQSDSSAAMVVSEVESDADLTRMMQELPAVEDLLEPPTTRPSSACSTPCSRRRARRRLGHPHRALRAPFQRALSRGRRRCAKWCSPTAPCTPR